MIVMDLDPGDDVDWTLVIAAAEEVRASEPVPVAEPEPAPEAEAAAEPEPVAEPATTAEAETTVEPEVEAEPAVEVEFAAEPGTAEVVDEASAGQAESASAESAAEVQAGLESAVPAIEAGPEPSVQAQTGVQEVAHAAEPSAPQTQPEPHPEAEAAPQPAIDQKAAARQEAIRKKIAEADPDSPFSILVGQVYDGPLDLLLDLIRKQDIDIYDIPIARITSQFLAYVDRLKATDVDVAGEFIYTASLLIHIKSKMLLPRAPVEAGEQPEDPRRELVERLLEHERFKNAAQMLQEKQMLEAASWSNPGVREFKHDEGTEPEIAADTVDLVRVFREVLERARRRPVINVNEDAVNVGQMIQFLTRRLTMEDKPVALRRLLSHTRSERALIAMFLALLELVRLQAILLRQDRQFSEIFIKKHSGFESVIDQGLARDDWQ